MKSGCSFDPCTSPYVQFHTLCLKNWDWGILARHLCKENINWNASRRINMTLSINLIAMTTCLVRLELFKKAVYTLLTSSSLYSTEPNTFQIPSAFTLREYSFTRSRVHMYNSARTQRFQYLKKNPTRAEKCGLRETRPLESPVWDGWRGSAGFLNDSALWPSGPPHPRPDCRPLGLSGMDATRRSSRAD